ncbi:MAG: hypothetical protein IJ493_09525 [Clostridia bacterium]|nr:hypothetical protein [Clostridia bacterium]
MKKLTVFLLLLVLAVGCVSCGGSVNDDELLSALEELAPKAHELYVIIYGDATPHDDTESGSYYKVSEDAVYHSINEMKAAMLEVFSPSYAQVLYNTAFNNASIDDGTMIYAKFIEKEDGLYVNPSATEGFASPRTFNLTGASVVKKNPYKATISIPTEDGSHEVTMQKVNGVWLIDTPLF